MKKASLYLSAILLASCGEAIHEDPPLSQGPSGKDGKDGRDGQDGQCPEVCDALTLTDLVNSIESLNEIVEQHNVQIGSLQSHTHGFLGRAGPTDGFFVYTQIEIGEEVEYWGMHGANKMCSYVGSGDGPILTQWPNAHVCSFEELNKYTVDNEANYELKGWVADPVDIATQNGTAKMLSCRGFQSDDPSDFGYVARFVDGDVDEVEPRKDSVIMELVSCDEVHSIYCCR